MNKKIKTKTWLRIIVLIVLVISYQLMHAERPVRQGNVVESPKVSVTFAYCIDGDTVGVYNNHEKEKIRLQGIDTPEYSKRQKDPLGKEASDYTCDRIKHAKSIEILFDESGAMSYDRKVGVVFVDGENLNIELVEQGLADLRYLKKNMPYYNEYQSALKYAQLQKKGLWKKN